jgi:signal peptidase II
VNTPAAPRASALPAALAGKAPYLLVSLAILVCDQWTKWLVELHLPHHVAHPVLPGLLNLTHVRNTGVAFGLFAAGGHLPTAWVLSALGILALAVVSLYFWRTAREHRLLLAALALVLGGAVGNLLDRLMTGAVTDFVDVYLGAHHWPAFNVADSAISIGVVLITVDTLWPRRR